MKTSFSDSSNKISIDKKSDLIKSELAKYRLLKSKGTLGFSQDENNLLSKNDFSVLSKEFTEETSYITSKPLIQSASSESGINKDNLKNDYSAASSNKASKFSNHSFQAGQSIHVSIDSLRGPFTQRDKTKNENQTPYFFNPPLSKDILNTSGSLACCKNISSSVRTSTVSTEQIGKSGPIRKSVTSVEKQKEKPFHQIEAFVDAELEKGLINKIYPKTVQHTSRIPNFSGNFSKIQPNGIKKVLITNEIKASSLLELDSKNIREDKNYTPTGERGRKKSISGASPKISVSVAIEKKDKRGNLAKEFSPRRLQPQKSEDESQKALKEEIEKWRIFGKMMAESYDDLNKKYTEYMKEKEKDKKIVAALKDQIDILKTFLKASKEENAKLKETSTKLAYETMLRTEEEHKTDFRGDSKETAHLKQEINTIREENKEALKMIKALKSENESLKNIAGEGKKYQVMANHYQKLADTRFKECSALAEEIICLRTDLDRSHSNYLRIQREQSSGKKTMGDSFYSGKKIRQVDQGSFLMTNSSSIKNNKPNEDQLSNCNNDDSDDQPPSPANFNVLPSKEESTNNIS